MKKNKNKNYNVNKLLLLNNLKFRQFHLKIIKKNIS